MKKIILLLFIPHVLISQETLSLFDAIEIGLNQNFDIQITSKNEKINEINNNWANAGALPKIDISAKNEEGLSDQSDNPASLIQEKLRSNSIVGSVNMNWTIFSGFAVRANKKRLENLEKISNNNAVVTIENTIQSIILQYYNCVLQKNQLNVLQEIVLLANDRLNYEKEKYKFGANNKINYLQTKNAMLTDSSNLIIQKLNYNNAVKNLNLLIGFDIDRKWTLTDQIDASVQIFNYEDLKQKTIENNSNIKNQYLNIQLNKQDIKLSMSSFYPMISLNSGASYNSSTYDIGELQGTIDNTGKSINYFANFAITFRLFDGGKLYKELQTSKILKEINELQYEKIKADVLNQLSINNEKYNSHISSFLLKKKALNIAQQNFEIANDKKNIGLINSFNLRDIEIAYINSALSMNLAAYNLMENKIAIFKITGGIIQEFNN